MTFNKWKSKDNNSWFSCRPGENGFLPVGSPLAKLPDEYNIINEILENMKVNIGTKQKGYLFYNKLKSTINEKLPLFDFENIEDKQLLASLHRDYCFMAAAYSLESSHNSLLNSEDNEYGIAENRIPKQLAIPLIVLSKKNNIFPWLDYAYGYGLNNAVLREGCDIRDYQSYNTVRTFNGCESEEGFINVHVAMVAQSGQLLKYQQECLQNISDNDREQFNRNLNNHFEIFYSIISTLQTMWKASKYSDYLSFRTFIMGQIGNKKCYPDEKLIFELGDEETVDFSFRGETGAQDSIIPSVDNFLQLSYPENKLTEYLYDLRKYRPKDHQEYINFMRENSELLKFKEYCMEDAESSLILLKNLNCLRMFRKKHWNLTKKYIIQNTKHPVATGGTPITTWLPNQLGATLEYMSEVFESINMDDLNNESHIDFYRTIKIDLYDHIQSIMDEVNTMQHEFNEQNHDEYLKRN